MDPWDSSQNKRPQPPQPCIYENQQQAKDVQQGRDQDHRQKTINTSEDTDTRQQSSKTVKTRYGRTVKKTGQINM